MAKAKAPFSNGMTEEEVIAFLKGAKPIRRNDEGRIVRSKKNWTEDELTLRNQLIIYWLTKEGYTRMECVNRIMSEFGISRSNAFDWSGEAIKTLNEGFDEYRDMARQMQIEKIEKCIKECRAAGKMKEAAMFSEQLNKIYGLYTDNKKVEVSAEGPIRFEFDK